MTGPPQPPFGPRPSGPPTPPNPPRLRTLLLLSNLTVLALPLAGLWALHLYESALVRQTESELLAQAAVVAAAFRLGLETPTPNQVVSPTALALGRREGLDLARDPLLPPPPSPGPAPPPDPRAAARGRLLEPLLKDAQQVTLAALRITDASGTVVATTGQDAGLSLAAWDEVRQVQAGALLAAGMHQREQPARDVPGGIGRAAGLRVFVALPVRDAAGLAGIVVLSRTPATLGQAAWGKRWPLAGMAALLLAAVAGVAAATSRLVARPIATVVAQARRAAAGDAAAIAPLQRPGTREVAELSAAIVRMAHQLEQRAGYIQAFAASVSHEFKTPLAAARAAAELLDDPSAPEAERQRLLSIVTGSTERLDQLVRRLLDLARADMMRPATPTKLRPVLETLDGIELHIDGDPAAPLPEPALRALFEALVENARKHGAAPIRLHARITSSGAEVTLADSGPGISAANAPRIFEPFFTTARASGGTGLGLPIARALAAAAGGTLDLLPSARGARFRVTFPAASAIDPA